MIGGSAAIALYLADLYQDPVPLVPLVPAPGRNTRARHDELCFFILTEMDAILYTIRRHEGLPQIYGESAVACEAARAYFYVLPEKWNDAFERSRRI